MFTPTLADISSWGGPGMLKQAEGILRRHELSHVRFADGTATAQVVAGGNTVLTGFKLGRNPRILAESTCRCPMNLRSAQICPHVVALGLFLCLREQDPAYRKQRAEEERHAKVLAAATAKGGLLRRADRAHGGIPAEVRIRLPRDWGDRFWDPQKPVQVQCLISVAGAPAVPIDKVGRSLSFDFAPASENLLFFLEEVCEGSPGEHVELTPSDFVNLIDLHRANRLKIYRSGGVPLEVRSEKVPVQAALDLDRENGELLLYAHPRLPGEADVDPLAVVVAQGRLGWVASRNAFWPIAKTLPPAYQRVYHAPIVIPRKDVVRFLDNELRAFGGLCDLTEEISPQLFERVPLEPSFSLRVKGTPVGVTASLHAQYDNGAHDLVAALESPAGDFAVPDPENLFRYRTRDLPAERAALRWLNGLGFEGANGGALGSIVGEREVLNFLATRVPQMRRRGWKVSFEGVVAGFMAHTPTAAPTVRIQAFTNEKPGGGTSLDWFEIGFDVRTSAGASLAPAEVQRAIQMGEAFVRRGDDVILLDTASVEAMRKVFRSCNARDGGRPGTFRMQGLHAGFVQSALGQAGAGVAVDAPPAWRDAAARQNRSGKPETVSLGEPLDGILRPYQKEGVAWLRFLEESRSGGILADEMGLGKTLQTLAWLQMERLDPAARGRPALIVAPTSLVRNWEHEALKFTPALRPLVMSGAERHEHWEEVDRHPLVITSYALLRRDLERYAGIRFSCAVLDEAQNIKNRATQNAQSVKQLQAAHRVVLTGTPVENGAADLWSILDFLMPGYLGTYAQFKGEYEMPLSHLGEPECEEARAQLHRKLRPFLLRRRKQDVAKDLPEKLVKVSYSALGPDQAVVYKALLDRTRASVRGMVASEGYGKSRMKVLAELMRLRQACCHLMLLKSDPALLAVARKAEHPSGKAEQFMELLDEAISGGHRMLVFSQFTTMLGLLRERLDAEGVRYCYLDGSTQDRLVLCQTFNSDASIPVFLISLKAGGTGLTLTGADMVVHFDPWWNPAVEDQATDRAHRIGQKKTVYCLKLIAEGTIEEKVLELQERKRALIAGTVESSAAESMDDVTWEDVQKLLAE